MFETVVIIFKYAYTHSDGMFFLHPVVEAGTPVNGNDEVERNLVLVEQVAYRNGLSPEAISIMLEFAMSLRMGKTFTLQQIRFIVNQNLKLWHTI